MNRECAHQMFREGFLSSQVQEKESHLCVCARERERGKAERVRERESTSSSGAHAAAAESHPCGKSTELFQERGDSTAHGPHSTTDSGLGFKNWGLGFKV